MLTFKFLVVVLFLGGLASPFQLPSDDENIKVSRDRCSLSSHFKNGRVRLRSRGRVAKFTCDSGYQLVGKNYATCVRARWTNPFPHCVAEGCPPVQAPLNGRVTLGYNGATAKFRCEPGFKIPLGTQDTLYCDGSEWDTTPPSCEASLENPPTSCDFEQEDLCAWTHGLDHDFEWRRHQYSTPSGHLKTGPTMDHTLGLNGSGHYLYIETSDPRKENDTALLYSPVYAANLSPACFLFWYHMYGDLIGSLRVFLKLDSQVLSELDPVWSRAGNHGNEWLQGSFSIPQLRSSFQIVFEGRCGDGSTGDAAIDDVILVPGACNSTNSSVDNMNSGNILTNDSLNLNFSLSITNWSNSSDVPNHLTPDTEMPLNDSIEFNSSTKNQTIDGLNSSTWNQTTDGFEFNSSTWNQTTDGINSSTWNQTTDGIEFNSSTWNQTTGGIEFNSSTWNQTTDGIEFNSSTWNQPTESYLEQSKDDTTEPTRKHREDSSLPPIHVIVPTVGISVSTSTVVAATFNSEYAINLTTIQGISSPFSSNVTTRSSVTNPANDLPSVDTTTVSNSPISFLSNDSFPTEIRNNSVAITKGPTTFSTSIHDKESRVTTIAITSNDPIVLQNSSSKATFDFSTLRMPIQSPITINPSFRVQTSQPSRVASSSLQPATITFPPRRRFDTEPHGKRERKKNILVPFYDPAKDTTSERLEEDRFRGSSTEDGPFILAATLGSIAGTLVLVALIGLSVWTRKRFCKSPVDQDSELKTLREAIDI